MKLVFLFWHENVLISVLNRVVYLIQSQVQVQIAMDLTAEETGTTGKCDAELPIWLGISSASVLAVSVLLTMSLMRCWLPP